MLTTEKDLANIPLDWRPDLPVIASVARLEMLEGEAFMEALIRRLHSLRAVS